MADNKQKNKLVIFYADDDADDRAIFSEAVAEMNYDLVLNIHDSGDKLLDALKNSPPTPSVVFIDLNMPGKNGYEVLKEIRTANKLKDLPVIVLSTSSDEQTKESSFKSGANYYFTKPTEYSALKQSISEALQFNGFVFN